MVVGRPEPPPLVVVVVLVVVRGPGPGQAPDVSHQRFVLGPAVGVVNLPAAVAEVVEAGPLTTEVGTLLHGAHTAEGVLQVGIHLPGHTGSLQEILRRLTATDLDFLAEPRGFDLNEGCRDGLHVAGLVVESDAARPDGIFVFVRVQPGVDHTFTRYS